MIFMVFINHSCEPNVGFAGNVVLVAMRDIAAGEELTTDYALFDDYDGAMDCTSGTLSCRRTIGGRDWQSRNCVRSTVPTSRGTCSAGSGVARDSDALSPRAALATTPSITTSMPKRNRSSLGWLVCRQHKVLAACTSLSVRRATSPHSSPLVVSLQCS